MLCDTRSVGSVIDRKQLVWNLSEMTVAATKSFETELAGLWGTPVHVNGSDWGGARRERIFFTVPPTSAPVAERNTRTNTLRDGWNWPLPASCNESVPNTLRKIVPSLVQQLYDKTLTDREKRNICQMRVFHMQHGRRFPRPPEAFAWLGWPDFVADELMHAMPCAGVISMTTQKTYEDAFLQHDQALSTYRPCGEQGYCTPCYNLLSRLGKSWHVNSCAAVIHQWLRSAYAASAAGHPVTYPIRSQIHVCTNRCQEAVTRGHVRNLLKSPQAAAGSVGRTPTGQ